MNARTALPVFLTGAALTLPGCASTYDRDLLEQRTRALYGRADSLASRSRERVDDDGAGDAPAAGTASETAAPLVDPARLADADLRDYLAYGLAHSADLRAAFEAWRASTERVEQVSTLPDPRLSYGEFLEEVQTRTGPQERRFGLSQAFPWPGKLGAEARVAEREAEAGWQRVEAARLRVAADVELAFHEYAYLARELAITGRVLDLLRGLEPVVQTRVRAGAGQEDILRLQVEIGRLEDDLASLERRRPVLSARLADALTLRDVPGGLLPLPELGEPVAPAADARADVLRALAASPRLRELAEHLAAARATEDLAGYRRKPGFAVGVDYLQTGDAAAPNVSGSGDDPVMVSLSMSLPVWSSSYSAAEREARRRVQAAHQRVVAAESELVADVEEEAYRIEDAARRIALYRDSLIPRASESLELTLAAYRTGSASVLDLIDSERALLEFELSFWRACREQLQAEARLRALTGGGRR